MNHLKLMKWVFEFNYRGSSKMEPMPYSVGEKIVVLEGPYKHRIGQVVGSYDGYPREWVKVSIDREDGLMFDWHEIRKVSDE